MATINLKPTHDAYVRGGLQGNNNFGTVYRFFWKSQGGATYNRKSYLQFDFSTLNPSWQFLSATLAITAVTDGAPIAYDLDGLTSAAEVAWDESTITFNNYSPNNTGTGSLAFDAGTFVDLADRNDSSNSPAGVVTIDDSRLLDWIVSRAGDSQATVGFGHPNPLMSAVRSYFSINDSDPALHPLLTITTTSTTTSVRNTQRRRYPCY